MSRPQAAGLPDVTSGRTRIVGPGAASVACHHGAMSDARPPEHSAPVDEAVSKVRSQTGCTLEEAFVLMHERATMSNVTMEDIIDAVIEGEVTFDVDSR
jgi:hypothetical protein